MNAESPTRESHRKAIGGWPKTVWLFAALASANLAVTASMNTWVLTDDVYRAILGGPGAQSEALIAMTRGWELLGYVLSPVVFLGRVGGTALLVQLFLVLLGRRVALARLFRAGLWAQTSLLAGTVAQLVLLASTPVAGRTPARLRDTPGAALGLLSGRESIDPALAALLERVTLFDLGWIALFVLALEHQEEAPALRTLVAATATALLVLLVQWTGSVYVTRLG